MPTTYGSPFIRITAMGTMYEKERFAWTLSVGADGGPPVRPTDAQAAAVLTAVTDFHRHTGVISGFCYLTGVKLARIGTNGLYVDDAPTEAYTPTTAGVPGTSAAGVIAPQIALAVSLQGPNPRGAAGRGRFYVPMPGMPLAADGRISAADATKVANAAVTMINAVNAQFSGRVAVVGAETAKGRAPAVQPVVSVRVGRVLDTIRSRRTSLDEGYLFAATAPTDGA